MSEPVMKRLKVSREGIVLIKSFEGFRPRAVRREDGSWIVGYGHTLSAREGASVSEADAELLLQYDLLPVAKAVNETVGEQVNQHQFDALASFAFSVGVERFQSSDVLERIRAGFSSEAADAMVGWPEPAAPEAALRRRAAERALFVADPASPVALADLLSAPLPPPPVAAVAPVEAPPAAEVVAAEAEPVASAAVDPQQTAHDARSAAVAHLLDTPASLRGPVAELGESVEHEASPEPDSVEIPDQTHLDTTPDDAPQAAAPEPVNATQASASNDDAVVTTDVEEAQVESAPSLASQVGPDANPAISFPPLEFQRYAPYGAASFGALPGIEPLIVTAPTAAASPFPPIEADEPSALLIDFAATGSSPSEAVPEAVTAEVITTEPALDQAVATVVEAPSAPAAPDILGANASPAVEPLILTPSTDTTFGAMGRLVWPEAQRDGDATAQSPLFDEDAILHRSLGPVVRPEMIDPETADRFSWGEAGAYLLMGGFGLVSFGMSMAALRLASQQSSDSGDTTMIAGVLFVIGVACVGVSTYNLYRRWGRPNAD